MERVEQAVLSAHSELPIIVPKPVYESVKRVQDTILAVTALIVLAPLWLIIALAIRLTSPGPVIYRQQNVIGRYGKPMVVYKFRTMYIHIDDSIHRKAVARFLKGEPVDTIEKNGTKMPVYKIARDPRVTRVGRLLRKTGLDETPQLINVLKGEMSLVGPRAVLWYEYEHYTVRHKLKTQVLPGITGLYQVTARSHVPFEEMIDIDLDYIARRSLWFDFKIMLKTPWVLITGKGAY
jgi:lipopolysaccharide/colanic/teichoic acid biosynthesis glycosyltransferase